MHPGLKIRPFLLAFLLALTCPNASLHAIGAIDAFASDAPASLAADSPEAILRAAAEGAKRTARLEAEFAQEKRLPFLDLPLHSSGKFCFALPVAGEKPYLFWEYREPEVSGFQYEQGRLLVWTPGAAPHAASAEERRLVQGLVDQVLQWAVMDPDVLRRDYEIRPAEARALLLVPRKPHLFSEILLRFNEDFSLLTSLTLSGADGETTRLDVRPVRVGELSSDCRR